MDYSVQSCLKPIEYNDVLQVAKAQLPWEALVNSHVLITGAGGFIGSLLVRALLLRNDLFNANISVTALVRNGEKAKRLFGGLLSRGDLRLCVQDVTEPIRADKADYVIHAASQASNIQFENDPVGTICANLTGTANVLDFAKESQSKAVLIISSLKVYGTLYTGKPSISEEDMGYLDITSYKNCYAMGKRASETLAASYFREYGLNVKIARPSYIYGAAGMDDDRVWAQFLANAVRGEDIRLKSDGRVRRSFCYVTDTAEALLTILLKGEANTPYNIADTDSNVRIRDFAQTVADVFPEKKLRRFFVDPADAPEPEELITPLTPTPEVLDGTRLRALGWAAKVSLREGITRSCAILCEREKG